MDLYIIPTYDPRFSRVQSRAVRYPRAMEPFVEGDEVPMHAYLIDEDGNYLTNTSTHHAGTYTVTAKLYGEDGTVLESVAGSSVTTTQHQYAFTFPLTSTTLGTALSAGAITANFVVCFENGTTNRAALYAPVQVIPLG
jgi:hypothetical protein